MNKSNESEHLVIRTYQPEDRAAVLTILRANIPKYFAESEYQDFVNYLDHEVEDYFVMVDKNRLVGCGGINYFPELKEARISWDMVAPMVQNKGIGGKLLLHRIAHIRSLGTISKIIVRTSPFAESFYKKHGFITLEKIPDYWAPGFDLVLMEFQ